MRSALGALNLGDIALQDFGSDRDVLIRVERQTGGEAQEEAAVQKIRQTLGSNVEYRRVEVVGPKVGGELITNGILAVVLSLGGILAYMAFRFGWRAGLSGVVAILHDCLTTVGLFSITGMQFDLNTVAAVVTIAGFSINDTVVIDDRIRENMRKFKSMDFRDLINRSVNETMSRTIMTNGLVFLAVRGAAHLRRAGPVRPEHCAAVGRDHRHVFDDLRRGARSNGTSPRAAARITASTSRRPAERPSDGRRARQAGHVARHRGLRRRRLPRRRRKPSRLGPGPARRRRAVAGRGSVRRHDRDLAAGRSTGAAPSRSC